MKLILPLHVVLPRKKGDRKWILNLNSYRNTHFQILNKAKILYKDFVDLGINEWEEDIHPGNAPFIFTYTVYPDSNRKFDLANVLPIVQKFTDDALIELGIISDDSFKIVAAINYRFGKVDKENPRVELQIEEWR